VALQVADLFRPNGDLRSEVLARAGIAIPTWEEWLGTWLAAAYATEEVASCLRPDAAAAAWAYYQTCVILDEEKVEPPANVNLGGELSTGRSQVQLLYWANRAKQYLADYQAAIAETAAPPQSSTSDFYSGSSFTTSLIFEF